MHGAVGPGLFVALCVVGSALFIVLVIARDGRIRRRTRAEFVALATRFGLVPGGPTRLGANYRDDGMTAVGRVEGVEVILTPRLPRKVTLLLDRRLGCLVSTARPVERPAAGLAEFSFGAPAWDALFPTRHATVPVAAWLQAQVRADTPLTRFAGVWADAIRADPNHGGHLTLESDRLSCALKRGSVFEPTGRPKFLRRVDGERLIPHLVTLARWVAATAPGPDVG